MEKANIEIPKQRKPFGVNQFYKELKGDYTEKLEKANQLIKESVEKLETARRRIENHINDYKVAFDLNLNDYEEYTNNAYINGELESKATYLYRNYTDDNCKYIVISLLKYAGLLKSKYIAEKNVKLYEKIINLSNKEYKHILKTYYYEVQHQMIANGYCYKFLGKIGWLCINRIKNHFGSKHRVLDTNATSNKKKELQDKGIELYNREKALYCELHNIPYNGVDYREYYDIDHSYEFLLINSKLPTTKMTFAIYKFEPTNYWSITMRKKTMEDIAKDSDGKIRYVTTLDIPFRRKLNICDKIDKTLYVNFIRNDNQTSLAAPAYYR